MKTVDELIELINSNLSESFRMNYDNYNSDWPCSDREHYYSRGYVEGISRAIVATRKVLEEYMKEG